MATAQVSTRPLTAEQFYELPEPEEGGKMELIDGRVAIEMPVNAEHGTLTGYLTEQLGAFVRRHRLGKLMPEVGFVLSRNPDNVRAPDLAFVAAEAIAARGLPKEGWIPYGPTTAVEVVSPSNLDADMALKVEQYLAAGVNRIWVVRPKTRTVTVHFPDHTARTFLPGSELASDEAGFAVAGLSLSVSDLFDDFDSQA